jgi:hypothetical protein
MKNLQRFCRYSTAVLLTLSPVFQLGNLVLAQTTNGAPSDVIQKGSTNQKSPGPVAANSTNSVNVPTNTLLDGTPVKLRLQRTLSSADAHVGDSVDFDVLEEVKVGEIVIIPKGSLALATVTTAEAKKRMGRGGKLDVNIDSVRLADNEKAALRSVQGGKGGGHVGAMTGAMVATGIVFFPAAPLFLFMHGKDITIPKGTEVTAYINGDFPFDPAKMHPQTATAGSVTSAAAVQNQLTVDANVAICDIEVDGMFAGNTPSQLALATGNHKILITKKGYKPWTKTIMVTGSGIRLFAELEAEQSSEKTGSQ